MKWHQGLPDSWDDLPDLPDDRREEVPSIDVVDRDAPELIARVNDCGIIMWLEGTAAAYADSDVSVDLEAMR